MQVGVVGCGYWGSKHVRVLHGLEDVKEIVAVDPRRDRLDALAASFPGLRSSERLEHVLEDLDAIVISTPPSTHAVIAERALDAGLHVLIEKPLTTSTVDAQRLVEKADAAGLTLMVAHTFQYNAAVLTLRDLVHSGDLGAVWHIDSARLALGLYQRDCNVIWDLAPHDVSILNHVLGSAPYSVQAWGGAHAHGRVEDVAYLRLEYPDVGVSAQVHVSWLHPRKVRRMTVVASRQMVVYDDLADEERIRVYDRGVAEPASDQELHALPMTYRYGDIHSPYISFSEPLIVQDRHFLDCVQRGQRPLSDGLSGLTVVRTLEAAQLSLGSRRAVALEELDLVVTV